MSIIQRIKASLVPTRAPPMENFENPFRFKVHFDSVEDFDEHIAYCKKLFEVFSIKDWFLSPCFTFHNTSKELLCNAKLHDESNLLKTLQTQMKISCLSSSLYKTKNPLHAELDYLDYYCSYNTKNEVSLDNFEVEIDMRSLQSTQISTLGPWDVTVVLNFDPCPIQQLVFPSATTRSSLSSLSICRKILEEEIASDAIIIASNDIPVKCHKSFLFAHSAVFTTMFQSGMQEGQTSSVELVDMSEEKVREMLAFMYCWNLTAPSEKSTVAFELLNAGHKYDIPVMETEMSGVLLGKPNYWFDLDVAVKLFAFSRNLPLNSGGGNESKLKKKAVMVMKEKLEKLEECTACHELFKESPQAAVELCRCAFST